MVSQSVKAVVLAGGVATWANMPKALLTLNGKPIVLRIVNALLSLQQVKQIAVVGPNAVLEVLPESLIKVEASSDLWANTKLGINALQPQPDDYLLLCAADMPFVTEQSLREFLDAAIASEADLVYLAVPMASFQRLFGSEKVRRTCARLKEGVLTGGNLLLLRARALSNIVTFADRAIQYRKSRWQLGKMAGWKILLKWVLSHLPLVGQLFLVSVDEIVKRGEELLGCKCKAIIAELPELAFDIDEPEDYEFAQRVVGKGKEEALTC
ncbi:MobA-like NTP transferase domain-containing protein [Candidatus Fervidibacteria bacterium JGI MDM2 SSWTFF-3-K9]